MPKALQSDTSQAIRESCLPYPQLIFRDNNTFPAQAIPLIWSCQQWMCVSRFIYRAGGSVAASELLPTRVHIIENPTPPSSPHGETNPLEQFLFFLASHTNLYCETAVQAPWKARSSRKAKCVLLDLVQLSSPGTQLCLVSVTLCSILRHDQVIPRDTQFIC